MALLRSAFLLLLFMTLITGGVYPLVTTAIGQWWFPDQASGSLLYRDSNVVGSRLTGQDFSAPGYFQGRPSATAEAPYNPEASGGSNLSANNPALDSAVTARVAALRAANPQADPQIPVELVTTSASGLDPHLSPQAVDWQIPRVAQARHLPVDRLEKLVAAHTQRPLAAFIGQPVVNIVELNMALDAFKDN